jgi:hypothetical protein
MALSSFKLKIVAGQLGQPATVENSDASYTDTVSCGGTLILPDETYEIYVNSVLVDSFSHPALKTLTINISPS